MVVYVHFFSTWYIVQRALSDSSLENITRYMKYFYNIPENHYLIMGFVLDVLESIKINNNMSFYTELIRIWIYKRQNFTNVITHISNLLENNDVHSQLLANIKINYSEIIERRLKPEQDNLIKISDRCKQPYPIYIEGPDLVNSICEYEQLHRLNITRLPAVTDCPQCVKYINNIKAIVTRIVNDMENAKKQTQAAFKSDILISYFYEDLFNKYKSQMAEYNAQYKTLHTALGRLQMGKIKRAIMLCDEKLKMVSLRDNIEIRHFDK